MSKILLTRPREDSERLAREILDLDLGHDPLIEPMMEIIRLPVILPDLAKFSGLAFTSANGVRAFAGISKNRNLAVYAVGEATAGEAKRAEFKNVIDCGGTIEAMNDYLAKNKIANILHLSGSHVSGAILSGSTPATRIALYEGRAATSLSSSLIDSLKQGKITKILFYSPRTAKIFSGLVKKREMAANIEHCMALCLSDSVVNSLSDLPWKRIDVAAAPEGRHMLALLDK